MKTLRLLRHGEYVRAGLVLPSREKDGVHNYHSGRSPGESRPAKVVKRFWKNRRQKKDIEPLALGQIKAVYRYAIEYTGTHQWTLRWMCLLFTSGGIGFLMIGGFSLAVIAIMAPEKLMTLGGLLGAAFLIVFGAIVGFAGFCMTTYGLSLAWFRVADLPILFDRRYRKVYRILEEESKGWRGWLGHGPIVACEYDWDLLDAEHVLIDAGDYDSHRLMFYARRSADDATIIDSFHVGDNFTTGWLDVPGFWEHIRRFMEEDGPHLPTSDEPLAGVGPPHGWWASIGNTGVFGPGYTKRWRTRLKFMLCMHIVLPVTLPVCLLWGTGSWLAAKTVRPVDWPPEVRMSVGEAKVRGV